MKLKLIGAVIVGLVAVVGVANAAGAFEGAQPESALRERQLLLVNQMKSQPDGVAAARRGPRGVRGPRGPQGPAGATGPKGSFSTITSVKGPTVFLAPFPQLGAVGSSSVNCPPGSRAIGGGWQGGGILATVGYNAPGSGEWSVILTNNNELSSTSFNVVAMCAA